MQEQLLALWQVIEARIRIVIFVVFLVMLLGVIYLWQSEKVPALDTVPPAFDPVLEETSATLAVRAYVERPYVPIENTQYVSLIANSMFDARAVRDAQQMEARVSEMFMRAGQLRDQQKWAEAMEMVNQVLTMRPSHMPAKKMKDELSQIMDNLSGGTRPVRPANTPNLPQ